MKRGYNAALGEFVESAYLLFKLHLQNESACTNPSVICSANATSL